MVENYVLRQWQRLHKFAIGRWLFSHIIAFRAPYFASISARFLRLEPWLAEVYVQKHRAVCNHIGTVHAIAMANACELAAGVMMEASLPNTLRWIPKGMQIDYVAKAQGSIRAMAQCAPVDTVEQVDVPVNCVVTDAQGNIAVKAVITMYVSARKR